MKTEALILRSVSAGRGASCKLDHINLTLFKGEVLGVYGIDGDRRALFIELLQGKTAPEEGTIRRYFDTASLSRISHRYFGVIALGQMSRHSLLIENMTVWENLFVLGFRHRRQVFLNRQNIRAETQKYLQKYLPDITPDMYVYQLARVQRLLLSILKAYLNEAQIIIVDNASFPYTQEEYASLRALIRDIAGNGVSFILISHHVNTLLELSNEVAIFHKERLVRHIKNTPENIDFIQKAVSLFTPVLPPIPEDCAQANHVVFRIENMLVGNKGSISVSLRSGEITVLCDPLRLTIRAIQKLLSTAYPHCRLILNGRRLYHLSGAFKRNEICFVEFSNRNNHFSSNLLLEDMPVSDNVCFSFFKKLSTGPFLHKKSMQFMTKEFAEWGNFSNISPYTRCADLEPNQKLALALFKLYTTKPSVIICKCNSQLDHSGKHQIMKVMRELTRSCNCAVALLVPEIADLPFSADRYLITDDTGNFQERSMYALLNMDARMPADASYAL